MDRLPLDAVKGAQRIGPALDERLGPFAPGQGKTPPFLAGRETEQDKVRDFLSLLAAQTPTDSDLILFGPRGNGKTVLLEWALREAEQEGIGTIDFYGAEIKSEEWLACELSVLPAWLRWFSGVSALGIGVKLREAAVSRIRASLARRVRKQPLLIAVDEAHTLGVEVGRTLLNEVQRLRRTGLPVMVLLAGTPDLPHRLNGMGASFWGRSAKLRIGLLKPDAAAEAIQVPFEAAKRSIAADALEQVVHESHGYPFFLQLWGKLLWPLAPANGRPVTRDDVERTRPRFNEARDEYYIDRCQELRKAGLAYVAARLSESFVESRRRRPTDVEEAVRSALQAEDRASNRRSVMDACERLHDLGYIWSVIHDSREYVEPGIPSLMRFVARSEGLDPVIERSAP